MNYQSEISINLFLCCTRGLKKSSNCKRHGNYMARPPKREDKTIKMLVSRILMQKSLPITKAGHILSAITRDALSKTFSSRTSQNG